MSAAVIEEVPGLSAAAMAELVQALSVLQGGAGRVERALSMVTAGLGTMLGTAVAGFGLGSWSARVLGRAAGMEGVATAALARAFDIAIVGMPEAGRVPDRSVGVGSRVLVAASGVIGGAAGLAGFAPDAAVTTLAIMRRIGRIALEEGEDLATDSARRACLEVFALRSGHTGVESEGGYYRTRMLLQGGPLLRLLAEVAAKYGVQLGQKLAVQAVPVAGAVCGAAINTAFMGQYERLARAHFTMRRLERVWGEAKINATRRTLDADC